MTDEAGGVEEWNAAYSGRSANRTSFRSSSKTGNKTVLEQANKGRYRTKRFAYLT